MAHGGAAARLVLYANFKSSAEHLGVHPDTGATPQHVREARASFQRRLLELKGEGRGEL